MKSIKYIILVYLTFTCLFLNSQERIAGFNWLHEGTLTFFETNNETADFLTDKSDTTFYVVNSSLPQSWIQCEFEEPIVITAYTLVSSYDTSYDPAKWILEYSENGTDWTEIHSQATAFSTPNYPLNIKTGLDTGAGGYKFYRFTVENAENPWSLAELQFFGCKANFDQNVTNNGGKLTGQYKGLENYNEGLANVIDGQPRKFCQTGTKSFWIEYEMPEDDALKLEKYSLTTAWTPERMPRSWEILGSNDGVNYELLDRQHNKNLFQAPYATHYYYIDSLSHPVMDWVQCADLTFQTLMDEYWRTYGNNYGKYFIQTNSEEPHMGYNYWWNAHALDIFVDGFQRTGKTYYKQRMEELDTSIKAKGGGSYWNTFYDDMEWMALACLRAYEATGLPKYKTYTEQLWDWIIAGWSDVHGGGIAWASGSADSKNACSNAPAMILAVRLYNLTKDEKYLTWAKRIFLWMDMNLYDSGTGYIWDGYNNTNVGNVYTYNIGTWMGGCMELYLVTGEEKYIRRAVKSANAVVDNMSKFSPFGILYNGENGGDGGLFKCIFLRYLSQMILRADLDEDLRNRYIDYMRKNGEALWNAGTMKPEMIVSKKFYERPDGKVQDSSVQMCGVMIFELLAELEREGLMPEKDVVISNNARKSYKYIRLNMQANNTASDSELGEWQLFGTTVPFEPNGVKENIVFSIPVQMFSSEKNRLTFIPNDKTANFTYQIFDINGRLHLNGSCIGNSNITLSSGGIYIVQINMNNQRFGQQILVK